MTTDNRYPDEPCDDHTFHHEDTEIQDEYVYVYGSCIDCGASMVRNYRYEDTEIHDEA